MHKKDGQGKNFGSNLLLILVCLLPLIIIFVLSGLGIKFGAWALILILVLCPLVLSQLFGHGREAEEREVIEPENETAGKKAAQNADTRAQTSLVKGMTDLFTWDVFFVKRTNAAGDAIIFEGALRARPEAALDILKGRFNEKFGRKFQLFLQQDAEENPVIVVVPKEGIETGKERPASNPLINIALLLATVVTTTIADASHQGINLFLQPGKFMAGVPYSFGIMAILGIHELGHYILAKWHGINTTLPYFIPIPFGLGTFGAVIQMKSQVRDRKALFDTGIAGPMAGLIVTIPLLFIGLKYSTVISDGGAGVSLSSSVLLAFISKLALGGAVTESHTVVLHPLAFAGWLGLMITALNLLPIGQLDGGHVSYALFGRPRAEVIAHVALFALIVLGIFVWSGWLMWALIVFFLSGIKSLPLENDVTGLDRKRVFLGAAAFVLLFLRKL